MWSLGPAICNMCWPVGDIPPREDNRRLHRSLKIIRVTSSLHVRTSVTPCIMHAIIHTYVSQFHLKAGYQFTSIITPIRNSFKPWTVFWWMEYFTSKDIPKSSLWIKICSLQFLYNRNIYITANLRNQIFPGIPNPFRESGESLK